LAAVGIPCVIKPVCEGSSVGISLVRDAAELTRALAQCFAVCDTALAETLIEGTEVTASVIGLDELSVLPIIEIIANAGEFYDYESKYTEGGSTHIIPARVSERAAAAVREAALCAHRVLGASGVSRTDMFVDKNDAVWLIETNTIPGMTPTSLLPDAARAAGIEVAELYDRLMFWAIERADAAKEVACGARASGLGESARVGEPAAAAGAGEKKRAGEPAAVAGPAAESERARAGEPLVSGERTHPAAPANPSGRTNAKEQQCTT
jgi:hypothetical protein